MPAPDSVVLETNLGNIQLELYWDHAPKVCPMSSISCVSKDSHISNRQTCENFVQLAKRGYYNGVIFHRIIAVCPLSRLLDSYSLSLKDFMVQGGDPTGTGKGGTSIYGQKLYVAHQFASPPTAVQITHSSQRRRDPSRATIHGCRNPRHGQLGAQHQRFVRSFVLPTHPQPPRFATMSTHAVHDPFFLPF